MRTLIAGCGYVGLALSRHLAKQGWSVWGLRRSESARDELQRAGAAPIIADLTRPQSLCDLPVVDYMVSCQAPGRGEHHYRSTYLDGTRNLVAAVGAGLAWPPSLWRLPARLSDGRPCLPAGRAQGAPLRSQSHTKFLFVSSTSVYGQSSDEWVSEETTPEPTSENARILLEAESVVLQSPLQSLVVRLGGIYGPGRERTQLLQNGTVSVNDPGYMNHIHVDDVVRLIEFLLERGTAGEIYLGVDDEPVLRSEFYRWLTKQAGLKLPTVRPCIPTRPTTSKRCSNQKVKSLGFVFKYPTYREGFSQRVIAKQQTRCG